MKVCARCGVPKKESEFSKHKGAADGMRSQCKPCRALTVKERRHIQPERHTLVLMIQRCHNQRHPKFAYYGGRGIFVADEWRSRGGFERFLSHVGPKPTPKHEIDRIDNDRGYVPGNVKWSTRSQQMRNTRVNAKLTAFGKTMTIRAWMAETGLSKRCIEWRKSHGWNDETILSTPAKYANITIEGVTRRRCEWAAISGVPQLVIRDRIRQGWAPKDAVFTAHTRSQ